MLGLWSELALWARLVLLGLPLAGGIYLAWSLWGSLGTNLKRVQKENKKLNKKIKDLKVAFEKTKTDGPEAKTDEPPKGKEPPSEPEEPRATDVATQSIVAVPLAEDLPKSDTRPFSLAEPAAAEEDELEIEISVDDDDAANESADESLRRFRAERKVQPLKKERRRRSQKS